MIQIQVVKKLTYALFALFLLTYSCTRDEEVDINVGVEDEDAGDVTLPRIAEPTFTEITTNRAFVTGRVLDQGGALVTRRGVVWDIEPDPSLETNSLEATFVRGDGTFSLELSGLQSSTVYYIRAYARNRGGVVYSDEVTFTTARVQSITFSEEPMFIIGSSLAAYDVELTGNGGGEVSELGVCWATSENPTITDQKATYGGEDLRLRVRYRIPFDGLTERTDYHLRAYAINEEGVSYGENIPFRTIGRGNVTYTFNRAANPTGEQQAAYDRLQIAIDSAVWYANNYTSAVKHVWVNYDPGVPTADANNEGWMRFGANPAYQNLRTMLHEMNHTFGTGTTSWWRDRAISGGMYQFPNANHMLQMITGNPEERLRGDALHWWRYGLNQNSEVTSRWDFVYNCLLIEAMRRDGLVSHSGGYRP